MSAAAVRTVSRLSVPANRMVFVQARNWSRSVAGIPRSSQITVIGKGNANAESRSTGPVWVGIAAISSSAICSIRGTNAATDRGVNAFATRRRSRVWSGGSVLSMCSAMSEPMACTPGWVVSMIRLIWCTSLRIVGSASTCLATV